MPTYTHDWIEDLASLLVMEDDHCRDEMRRYKEGPDHDLYASHRANVTELQRRLRLYDAADSLLERLKAMVSGLECECDKADPEHPLCDVCWSRQVIDKAEGRSK